MTETDTVTEAPATQPAVEKSSPKPEEENGPAGAGQEATPPAEGEEAPETAEKEKETEAEGLQELPGPLSLDHFDLRVTLGTGSFGRVRLAIHKGTNTTWAIKMLKKAEVVRLQQVEHIISEKTILSALRHPFIVRLAGTFQDERFLYMCLEFIIGGEFFTHLRKAGRFDAPKAKFYTAQIALIFEYLHGQDIIYRDLKPENLLLDNTGYIKITDFGFAKHVTFKTYTLCGTPEYIAPEVLLNKGHGKGVDWWTLGILIYEMLAGQPPFVDEDPMGIYQQVIQGKVAFPRFLDRKAKSLVKKLLVADLTKRYGCLRKGAADVKDHKWFTDFSFEVLIERGLPAPIIPEVSSKTDTSNFDAYPDDDDVVELPVYSGPDPFENF